MAKKVNIIQALSDKQIGLTDIVSGTGIPLARLGELSIKSSKMTEKEKEALLRLVKKRNVSDLESLFVDETMQEASLDKRDFFYGVKVKEIQKYISRNNLSNDDLNKIIGVRSYNWNDLTSDNVPYAFSYLKTIVAFYEDAKKRGQVYNFVKRHKNMPKDLIGTELNLDALIEFTKEIGYTQTRLKEEIGVDIAAAKKGKHILKYGQLLRLYELAESEGHRVRFLKKAS